MSWVKKSYFSSNQAITLPPCSRVLLKLNLNLKKTVTKKVEQYFPLVEEFVEKKFHFVYQSPCNSMKLMINVLHMAFNDLVKDIKDVMLFHVTASGTFFF